MSYFSLRLISLLSRALMVLCWSTLWKQKVQKGNDLRLELPQVQPGLLGGVCSGAFWRRALPVRSMKRSNKALDADGWFEPASARFSSWFAGSHSHRIHGAARYGNMDPINIPQSCYHIYQHHGSYGIGYWGWNAAVAPQRTLRYQWVSHRWTGERFG